MLKLNGLLFTLWTRSIYSSIN